MAGLAATAKTLALAAGGLVVAISIGEVVARWTWPEPAAAPAPPPPGPGLEGVPVITTLSGLLRPNARGIYAGRLYETNSLGFRGREYDATPPSGAFRIVLVGDSFAMGAHVATEETYAMRVEAGLTSPEARLEVLNLGVDGANLKQILNRLERVGLPFEPRLVIYGFTLNDIETREETRASRRNPRAADARRFHRSQSYLLRALWPRWVWLRSQLRSDTSSHAGRLVRDYADPEKWARITNGLDSLAALAGRSGICAHVLIHPMIADLRALHPYERIYNRVGAAAEARGLSVTRPLPNFRWKDAAELRVSPIDGHPNAEGHRLLAEALLEDLPALPERCGFPALNERR